MRTRPPTGVANENGNSQVLAIVLAPSRRPPVEARVHTVCDQTAPQDNLELGPQIELSTSNSQMLFTFKILSKINLSIGLKGLKQT